MLRPEIDSLLEVLRRDEFGAGTEFSNEELDRRVNAYQDAAADLGLAIALLGNGHQCPWRGHASTPSPRPYETFFRVSIAVDS